MTRQHRIALGVAVPLGVVAVYVLGRVFPVQGEIAWIRHQGVAGVAVFFALFLASNTLALPSTPLYVAAGLLYGTWWGALLTTVGSLTVELLVILLVRTRARSWLDHHADRNAKVAAIDRAVSKSSFWVLWLLRLSPAVPFGLLNYALAGARVSLRRRLAAHVLGMGPGNVVQAYMGSLLAGVGGLGKSAPGRWRWVLLGVGIVTAIAAFVITGIASKRVLAEHGDDPQPLPA